MRDTDSHNTALLAKERQEARARQEKLQRQYDGRLSPPVDGGTWDTAVTKISATKGAPEVSDERCQKDLEQRSKDIGPARERSHSRSPERKSKHRDSHKHERSSKHYRSSKDRDASEQKDDPKQKDPSKQKDSSKHKHKLKDPLRKRHRSESSEQRSTNERSSKQRHRSRSVERQPLGEEPSKKRRRNRSAEPTPQVDRSSRRHRRSKNREEKGTSENCARKRHRSKSPDDGPKEKTQKRRKGIGFDDKDLADTRKGSQKEEDQRSSPRRLTEPVEEDEKHARRRRRKEKKALISTLRSSSPKREHDNSAINESQQHYEPNDSPHANAEKEKQLNPESNVEGGEAIRSKSRRSKHHHRKSATAEYSNRSKAREAARQKSSPEDEVLRIKSKSRTEMRSSTKGEKSTDKPNRHSKISKKSREHDAKDVDPLEEILGPLPPAIPPQIRTRGRGKFTTNGPSAVDRLNPEYDPMMDMQPDSGAEDDEDQAVEAMRDRLKWQQAGADRLRNAGFSEEQVSKWEKSGKDGEGDVNDVRWKYRGEGREWDRGKVVKLDADDNDGFDVEVRADWNLGRLK